MNPVIKASAQILIHVPDLVRYGDKPWRDINLETDKNIKRGKIEKLNKHLRKFEHAYPYAPNQVFVGDLHPDELRKPFPWFGHIFSFNKNGKFGMTIPQEEFYKKLKDVDVYDLIWLKESFCSTDGKSPRELGDEIDRGEYWALPLYDKQSIIGCFRRAPDEHAKEDDNLRPRLMLENLTTKASGAMALEHLLKLTHMSAADIDFVISCSEEAIGDRYNRGGGSMAKAIAEACGCENATGPDVKAFCAGPIYAAIIAASLVKAGVCKNVAVVGGGCLAKLGMKYQGHVAANMPVIEDMLGAIAFLVSENDGVSPIIRLDSIGKCNVRNGASQQAVMESLIVHPLQKLGMKLTDVNKYAVELHNPEITIPSKTGDVPRKNYEMIAALAIKNKEITREQFEDFIKKHGMPGFAPTQGHIPAAIPFLGHAIEQIKKGEIKNAMFVARGSLFLGRMSRLFDGASFLLEKNRGG